MGRVKYISDYWNISTATPNILAIIGIYRLTDKTDNEEEGVPTYWHTLVFITINEYHVSKVTAFTSATS